MNEYQIVIANADVVPVAFNIILVTLMGGDPNGYTISTNSGRNVYVVTDSEDPVPADVVEAIRCLDDHLDNVAEDEGYIDQYCINPDHIDCFNHMSACTHVDVSSGTYYVGDVTLTYFHVGNDLVGIH